MLRQQQRISESRSTSEERLATINNSKSHSIFTCKYGKEFKLFLSKLLWFRLGLVLKVIEEIVMVENETIVRSLTSYRGTLLLNLHLVAGLHH